MAIDGLDYSAQSQGTLADIRPSPIFSAGGMDDTDHQIFLNMPSLPANALIFLDYFEYVIIFTSFRPKDRVPTNLPLPGLKIRLEGALIFSVLGQLRLKYPHRRSLWTILVQILSFRTLLCGILQGILVVTKELGGGLRFLVIRLVIPLMGSLYGTTAYLIQYNYRTIP